MTSRAEIVVDLDAIRGNVAVLTETCGPVMAIVKADGYGHGMLESARAARAGGAEWLGVAVLEEALALREAGDTGPILCWLAIPGEDYSSAVGAGIDVTAYTVAEVEEIVGVRPRPSPCACSSRSTPGSRVGARPSPSGHRSSQQL